ncbi:MAG: NADP-dependent malic enzyme [Candidatus Pacebacteria bacterium]|nr:NADP-dependent malic enzyme [Candidatus Paceibacterota bacterium]MCD8508250.1 NADP-dependent malic enzyme [Candidatus Paceibacterota bacterium]MCD8527725.1 NADP-dependent malic enzyme [Candidatus Paceibacterota bacterium]MCD8563476.1 NADP-dependent malic enzyme [Candidatus Paceibacterota bacterium]
MSHSYQDKARALHKKYQGKIELTSPITVSSIEDLATVYSPGVAAPAQDIADHPHMVYDYTLKGRTIAVVSDGSAVLGLGNIGPEAALPVMEGKAMLFKQCAGLDAFPLCINTQDTEEIITFVKQIAPTFGGVNLEDISAPRCFEIEERLQDIGIPVFHDDQHGTAIVTLAGLINASKVVGIPLSEMNVVIQGVGAAGVAIAKLLLCHDQSFDGVCHPVKSIIMCDRQGIVHRGRTDLNSMKASLLEYTNTENKTGTLADALQGAHVFIGVSQGNTVTEDMVRSMADNPIIFAMANPTPEIAPELAHQAGAAIVSTGRSDYPNQVNNILAFPGVFKGALSAQATRITTKMKYAAAYALADLVPEPSATSILPKPLDPRVVDAVAQAVHLAA